MSYDSPYSESGGRPSPSRAPIREQQLDPGLVTITSCVGLPGRTLQPTASVDATVQVSNGNGTAAQVQVSLLINGLQETSKTVTVLGQDSLEFSINFIAPEESGTYTVDVEILSVTEPGTPVPQAPRR